MQWLIVFVIRFGFRQLKERFMPCLHFLQHWCLGAWVLGFGFIGSWVRGSRVVLGFVGSRRFGSLVVAIQESLIGTLRLEVVTSCQPPRLLAPRCGSWGLIDRGVFGDFRGKP